MGQAQSNHWGAGGGGKLILPGVVSDETIESNHCAFVMSPKTHYGAMAGPMRTDIDEAATMCGLTATLNSVLDTKGSLCFINFGAHPDAHLEAIRYFNGIYAYDRPAGGPADIGICGVFAPTDHLFFHTGWGCMSSDLLVRDGGTLIYCSPSPGVKTHLGDFPGLALMDLMKPYMPPSPANLERVYRDIHSRTIEMWAGCIWVPIYEVMVRKHLHLVTLEENLDMAADIGIEAGTSLEDAFAAAMTRHGPDAKVAVLPFARYQLPRDAIRMPMEAEPLSQAAGVRRAPCLPPARLTRPQTITGSTTVVQLLERYPGGEAAELMAQPRVALRPLLGRAARAHQHGRQAPREPCRPRGPCLPGPGAGRPERGGDRRGRRQAREAPRPGRALGPLHALERERWALALFISLRRRAFAPLAWLSRQRRGAQSRAPARFAVRHSFSSTFRGCRSVAAGAVCNDP